MHQAFVDVHHHLLCGLDDGPKKAAAMQAMIDAACEDGVGLIIATPHATPGIVPFDRKTYAEVLAQANAYCIEKGYDLRILGGAEIMYTAAAVRLLQDQQAPTLAGTRFVLVEWPGDASLSAVTDAVRNLTNAGYIPVMAHVERLQCFRGRLDALRQLKEAFDIRVQINADTIPEHRTLFSRSPVPHLLRSKLVDYIASDAHDVQVRRIQMKTAYLRLSVQYGEAFADELMRVRPMEIISAAAEEAHNAGFFRFDG